MRQFAYAMLCLLTLLPAAAAEYNETKPDCPPDMLCTTSVDDGGQDIEEDPTGYNESHVMVPDVDEAEAKASGFAVLATLGALGAVGAVVLARRP